MHTVYIAFGSNLGDRRANIRAALDALATIAEGDMKVSSLWETGPVGMAKGEESFLNGVVRIRTRLSPRDLLERLQDFEEAGGRPRKHGKNRARTIDLDIVSIDDLVIDLPDLVVPHPRARERRFVLAPLAEIAPDLVLPGESQTVAGLLSTAPEMEISKDT